MTGWVGGSKTSFFGMTYICNDPYSDGERLNNY